MHLLKNGFYMVSEVFLDYYQANWVHSLSIEAFLLQLKKWIKQSKVQRIVWNYIWILMVVHLKLYITVEISVLLRLYCPNNIWKRPRVIQASPSMDCFTFDDMSKMTCCTTDWTRRAASICLHSFIPSFALELWVIRNTFYYLYNIKLGFFGSDRSSWLMSLYLMTTFSYGFTIILLIIRIVYQFFC